MWREIRGGRAASALMSSCLSLCSSVVRILCLLSFFSRQLLAVPPEPRAQRFDFLQRPIHVRGRAAAPVCACADSCMDVYQRVGVGERPRWKERRVEREGVDHEGRKNGREGSVQRGERAREEKKKRRQERETRRTQPLPIDAGGFGSGAPRSADTGRWSQ